MISLRPIIYSIFVLTSMFACQKDKPISEDELLRVPFISKESGSEKDFYLYLPKGYRDQPEKKWPVILFLHGDGERGNSKEDLKFVLTHGPLYEAWVQKKELPFVIISPQLPLFGRDTLGLSYLVDRDTADVQDRIERGVPDRTPDFETPIPMGGFIDPAVEDLRLPPNGWEQVEEDLLIIINQVLNDYQTDPDRLYLTGLSYGGFGTWHMASNHPALFAAASPIVGWGHPDQMAPIVKRKLPLWVFSGGRDQTVLKKHFIPGVNKLEELGYQGLRYTIHEDMGHDVWKRVYAGDDLYHWFLEHSL